MASHSREPRYKAIFRKHGKPLTGRQAQAKGLGKCEKATKMSLEGHSLDWIGKAMFPETYTHGGQQKVAAMIRAYQEWEKGQKIT